MEKESTTSRRVGMCEKLFNVFNPASRSHRRLTLHQQKPEATTNPSPTQPNHSLDYGLKEPSPQKAFSTPVKPRPPAPDQKKPSEAIAPKAEQKPTNPPPPPIPTSVPVKKVPDKVTSAPPKAAVTPQPVPQPAPPRGTAAAERPKKNINEKVDEYIKRARDRIRTVSGVGRTSVLAENAPDKVVLTSTPQPVPQPAPPRRTATAERPKKNINNKVEEYIKRARDRIRTVSGVGRTPTS